MMEQRQIEGKIVELSDDNKTVKIAEYDTNNIISFYNFDKLDLNEGDDVIIMDIPLPYKEDFEHSLNQFLKRTDIHKETTLLFQAPSLYKLRSIKRRMVRLDEPSGEERKKKLKAKLEKVQMNTFYNNLSDKDKRFYDGLTKEQQYRFYELSPKSRETYKQYIANNKSIDESVDAFVETINEEFEKLKRHLV